MLAIMYTFPSTVWLGYTKKEEVSVQNDVAKVANRWSRE